MWASPMPRSLIVMNEPVPFDELPSLRLVANFSVGYDRIDVEECRRRGIALTNTPGVLDAAVADLTFALILATRRRLVEGDAAIRAGGWQPAGGPARPRGEREHPRDRRHGPHRHRGRAPRRGASTCA